MKKIKAFTNGLTFRIAFATVVWFLIFNIITSLIGYMSFTKSFTKEYNASAFHTAQTSAQILDGDKIDEYLENPYGSAEYNDIQSRINNLCQTQGVTYIYVIKPDKDADYTQYQFVFSTAVDDGEHTPIEINGEYRDTTNEEYRQIYEDIYENGLEQGTVIRTKNLKSGSFPHITSLVPIKADNGEVSAILAVERPMAELALGRRDYLKNTLYSTILLIVLSVLAIVFYLVKQVVTPTKRIVEETKRFAKENTAASDDKFKSIGKVSEINELAEAILRLERDNVSYMKNLTKVTAERERIDTELALARRIQANELPNTFPPFPDRREFDIFACMTPAKEVGGDFYDFFMIDNDRLGIVMADVSGKGVGAALFMMSAKNLIKSRAMQGGVPSEVLTSVNKEICANNSDNMFVTVWFGILTISTGKIVAANAGHEYPVIRRGGGKFEIFKDKHGFVIGGMDMSKYRDYEFELSVDDMLFLYTDGVTEANNKDNELFGNDRMLESLNMISGDTPRAVLEGMNGAISDFVGEAQAFDDITMLALKYEGGES